MIIILLQHRHMIWGVLTLIGGICYHVDDWVMFVSLRHLVWVSSYSLFNLKWYISIVEISFLLICTCVSFLGKSICRWLFVWIWIFMVDKIHLWIIFFSFSNLCVSVVLIYFILFWLKVIHLNPSNVKFQTYIKYVMYLDLLPPTLCITDQKGIWILSLIFF